MGQAVPDQHPAVVLKSHFNALRALLAVALIAVIGLTVAVVVLAANDGTDASAGSVTHVIAPSTVGPDESRTADAITSGQGGSASSGGPDESVVANAVSGR
jgi:hypothetical protein